MNLSCGIVGIEMHNSGSGLVIVDKTGMKESKVNKILGTVAQFMIDYT